MMDEDLVSHQPACRQERAAEFNSSSIAPIKTRKTDASSIRRPRNLISKPTITGTRQPKSELLMDTIPGHIKHYCDENGWTDPFSSDSRWWGFPPGAVMPLEIEIVFEIPQGCPQVVRIESTDGILGPIAPRPDRRVAEFTGVMFCDSNGLIYRTTGPLLIDCSSGFVSLSEFRKQHPDLFELVQE